MIKLVKKVTGNKFFLPLIFLVCLAVIGIASVNDESVETDASRIMRLKDSFACPECNGQSVAESNAAVASNISRIIESEVAAGSTDTQIRDLLLEDWGESILLNPSSEGISRLVWMIPIGVIISGLIFFGLYLSKSKLGLKLDQTKLILTFGFLVLVVSAVAYGLSLFVGERGVNEAISGSINLTPGQQLDECEDLTKTGRIAEGLKCVDDLILLDPENSQLLANRGWYFALAARSAEPELSSKWYGLALADLNSALDIKPTNQDALAWRGIIYSSLSDTTKACQDFESVLDLNPDPFLLELIGPRAANC